jgi:hypothetical protein
LSFGGELAKRMDSRANKVIDLLGNINLLEMDKTRINLGDVQVGISR